LNGLLALIAGGKVQIDVRPLSSFLREETLEEQVHAYGIDGCDPQRITDDAVGSRAAALDENAVLPAKFNDVPDDQEISGKTELFDEPEFTLRLLLRSRKERRILLRQVARPHALLGAFAQKRIHRLAVGHRVTRKLVAKIVHLEREP
jgi:hypothetical protein